MLTPFDAEDRLDHDSLERLTNWYLEHDADALFAVCQSSEMQHLSVAERTELARTIVGLVGGQKPIVASGHISTKLHDQISELTKMSTTGIDALVLVTNRLDPKNLGYDAFRYNLEALLNHLPPELPLGLYECPAPFRRLLSDDELKFCRDTNRFVVLKDVSCDLEIIKHRLNIVDGTQFGIINANAAIAFRSMLAGSPGFAGVFTNFHPDLYAWLLANCDKTDPHLPDLVTFLAMAANAEAFAYPVLAKLYHQKIGTISCAHARAIDYDARKHHWALDNIIEHIIEGTERFRARIFAKDHRMWDS